MNRIPNSYRDAAFADLELRRLSVLAATYRDEAESLAREVLRLRSERDEAAALLREWAAWYADRFPTS